MNNIFFQSGFITETDEEKRKAVIAQSDKANEKHAQEVQDRKDAIRAAGGKGLPGPKRYRKPYKRDGKGRLLKS